jgi:hypothetical protein
LGIKKEGGREREPGGDRNTSYMCERKQIKKTKIEKKQKNENSIGQGKI